MSIKIKKLCCIAVICIGILFIMIVPFAIPKYQAKSMEGKNPFYSIKKYLALDIPTSSKVIEYTYDKESAYLAVQLQIDEKDLEEVQTMLNERFPKEISQSRKYQNHLSWWNIDSEQIIQSYQGIAATPVGKKGAKTVPVWAYLTCDDNGIYFLYLDKYWCKEMVE